MAVQNVNNKVVCLDAPDETFLGKDDFVIHALGPTSSPWAYSKLLMPWLLENLGRFDAVIVHGLWLYPTYCVMKAMEKLKNDKSQTPPWYVMPHGMLDPYFQKAPERRLKAIRNRIYWSLIEGKVIQSADAILFTCQEELNLAKDTFPNYRPKAEWNVGYGVEAPPEFNSKMSAAFQAATGLRSDEKYILFLSRIHPKKGVDLLIESYLKLKHESEGADFEIPKLVIAGPGMDTDFGKKLLSTVLKNKSLSDSVIFPGMLSGNTKWGAFYGADAFCLPSHQENFGIAVAESLACSTPVLISNQVNIWREIEEGNAGIVAVDTAEGTYSVLEKWVSISEESRMLMAENAFRTFEKKFKISSNIRTMLKYLSEGSN